MNGTLSWYFNAKMLKCDQLQCRVYERSVWRTK